MRISELASHLGGLFEGDGNCQVSTIASLENAGDVALSFVASSGATLRQAAINSRAACLLVPHDFQNSTGRTIIRVGHTRPAFIRAETLLRGREEPNTLGEIHPTAVIAPSARISELARIGPYTVIEARVQIGDRVIIGAHCHVKEDVQISSDVRIDSSVIIYPNVDVGEYTIIHSGAVIGSPGFGFEFIDKQFVRFPQSGPVKIGSRVEIGANSCIDAGLTGTTIGTGTKIDNLVHIGHNCTIGRNVVIAAQSGFSGSVTVEDDVQIGGQVGIGEDAVIKTGVALGGQSGVYPKTILDRSIARVYTGTPAEPRWKVLRHIVRSKKSTKHPLDPPTPKPLAP